MKEKKIISHKFFDKHTIPGVIFLMLWGMILPEFIIAIPVTIMTQTLGLDQAIISLASAAGAFLVLAIHKRWFYPEFEGCLKSSVGFLHSWKVAAAILFFWFINFIIDFASGGQITKPTLNMIALSLMAGCVEEAAFRGLGISYLMRQWRDKNKITSALVITSAAFGLIHATNIFSGAGIVITILQTVSAFFFGLFLGGVFLRCGNLWPLMIIHFVEDILAGITTPEGYILTHTVGWGDWADTMLCIGLGLIGLYLIREERCPQIIALWDEKWKRQ